MYTYICIQSTVPVKYFYYFMTTWLGTFGNEIDVHFLLYIYIKRCLMSIIHDQTILKQHIC